MCGRFVLITDLSVIARDFDVPNVSVSFLPNRNVTPGQHIPAVIRRDNVNLLTTCLWGLIPSWAKDASIGIKLINARAETITQKPSFKNAFVKRRCLIPADGFYEWKKEGNKKIPYYFCLKSGKPFGLAGLYETWIAPDRKKIDTCTIITTRANVAVQPIHDRMPVIVPEDQQNIWLDSGIKDPTRLLDILKPYPAMQMECTNSQFNI